MAAVPTRLASDVLRESAWPSPIPREALGVFSGLATNTQKRMRSKPQ
jgi:hypothetical protein